MVLISMHASYHQLSIGVEVFERIILLAYGAEETV